jgi:hypothetical protein
MPYGRPNPPERRADLERWADAGCRVSRCMLDHDLTYAEAIEMLVGARPRPSVILDLDEYPDEDQPQQTQQNAKGETP